MPWGTPTCMGCIDEEESGKGAKKEWPEKNGEIVEYQKPRSEFQVGVSDQFLQLYKKRMRTYFLDLAT